MISSDRTGDGFTSGIFTLRENIGLSNPQNMYDDNQIIKSLKFSEFNNEKINIDSFIGKDFESDGIELSGGQFQKVAISRAVFRDANLVLLDEPTSSLDPEAENKVLYYFKKLYSNKTLFMISHKLSSTNMMDKIIVIENGEIIEIGNHKELISKRGSYYQLYNIQASNYN